MDKRRELFVSGFALFSMFFGAGNLIFPPTLGLMMGTDWLPSFLGFALSGVGLVVLGAIATTRCGGGVMDIAAKVGRPFAMIYGTLMILAIGPGLAIPRTAAMTHELLSSAFLPNLPLWVTSLVFFAITLFFTLNPGRIIDRLGQFLTPALLFVLAVIIVKTLLFPHAPVVTEHLPAFSSSFVEGYQTLDVIAALAFTSIVIEGFRLKGYEGSSLMSLTVKSCLIAGIALCLIYGGLLYMGAVFSGIAPADIEKVPLLVFSSRELLGTIGMAFMVIAMALACLTTSIGLTATVGLFFKNLSRGKLSYNLVAIVSSVFSAIVAVNGLERILEVSVPILLGIYPVSISLIVLALFGIERRSTAVGVMIGSLIPAVDQVLALFGMGPILPEAFGPFFWMVPTIVLGLLFTPIKLPAPRPLDAKEHF